MPPVLKRILQLGLLIAGIFFLVLLFRSQWQELAAFEWQLQPGVLALAFALLYASWAIEISLWRFILLRVSGGRALGWWRAAQIWFLSNIVRYIPGNIWQFISMVGLSAEEGIPARSSLTSIVLHQVLVNLSGLVLAAIYFAWQGQIAVLRAAVPALVLIPALIMLNPPWLERFLNWILRRLKREPIEIRLSWREMLMLLGGYIIVWIVLGAGFAALTSGITTLTPNQWPYLIAVFAAAYVLGYLSLITPSGLGVREGIIVLLLTPIVPVGVAAVVAAAARVWLMAGEALGAGVSLITWPQSRKLLARGRTETGEQTP